MNHYRRRLFALRVTCGSIACAAGLALALALTSVGSSSTATAASSSGPPFQVYWTNQENGTIGGANLDGSSLNANLITGATIPQQMAVVDGRIYWVNGSTNGQSNGSIGVANPDGSGVDQSLITGLDAPIAVTAYGSYLYWTNGADIGRANLDGSGVNRDFITTPSAPFGIVVTAQHIYWTSLAGDAIGEANLDGSDPANLITGITYPVSAAVSSSHIYWTDGGYGQIGEANLNGSGVNAQFISSGVGEPTQIAIDSNHLYWIDYGSGEVDESNLDGSGVTHLFASGAVLGEGLAIPVNSGGGSTTTTSTGTTTSTTATTTTTTSKLASATAVSCNQEIPESEEAGEPGIAYLSCTATVSGTNGTGVAPTGSVTFKDAGSPPSLAFEGLNTCSLKASTSGPTSYCTINVLPSANPIPTDYQPPVLATYSGDANFAPSSASPQLGPGPEDAENPEDPQGQDDPTDPNGADPTVATVPVSVSVDPPASGPVTVTTSGGGASTVDASSLALELSGASWTDQLRARVGSATAPSHWLVCRRSGAKLVCDLGHLAAHAKVKVHLLLGFLPAAAGQTKHLSVVASETVKGKVKRLARKTLTVKVPKRTVLSATLVASKTTSAVNTVTVRNLGTLAATKLRICLKGTDGLTPVSAPGAKLSGGELCLSDKRLARGVSLAKAVKVRGSGVLEAVVSAGNAKSVTVGV